MSASILVADGQSARAKRIVEACTARGFAVRHAPHGPAALEVALADVPDVVVAPLDLPLIDGRKLAEILRANPRAHTVRFVFLGRDVQGDYTGASFDEQVAPASDPEEIAVRVESLLAERARMDAAWRDAEAEQELEGRLSQIPLTDLLQLFHMNRRTGTIELTRRASGQREERGTIWLREGNLVQAAAGPVEGEKALFRLLAWRDGSFSFAPNQVSQAPRILTPTRALLMEGMRQLDEWDRVRASLPALDARLELRVSSAELPNSVHPLTQEVLLLLEIYDRVRDIVDHCTHPDYQVLRTLQALVDREVVSLSDEVPAGLSEGAEGLFTPNQVRRLREWLQTTPGSGSDVREAKVLVFTADETAGREFARLLGEMPGLQVEEPFRSGTARPDDLLPLARLPIEHGIAIQFLHVPTSPINAPIWPIAAYGALGSLLVHEGAESTDEAAMAAAEVLGRAPRSRLFHLVLLRKGERLQPEEVQTQMARVGDGALFLVPGESGREANSLMRTMLQRVMP